MSESKSPGPAATNIALPTTGAPLATQAQRLYVAGYRAGVQGLVGHLLGEDAPTAAAPVPPPKVSPAPPEREPEPPPEAIPAPTVAAPITPLKVIPAPMAAAPIPPPRMIPAPPEVPIMGATPESTFGAPRPASVAVVASPTANLVELSAKLNIPGIMDVLTIDLPRRAIVGTIPKSRLPKTLDEIRLVPGVQTIEVLRGVAVTLIDSFRTQPNLDQAMTHLLAAGLMNPYVTRDVGVVRGNARPSDIPALRAIVGVRSVEVISLD